LRRGAGSPPHLSSVELGPGGIVIGDFGTGHDWARSLELQPDGKLLVAGSIYEDEAVARFRAW